MQLHEVEGLLAGMFVLKPTVYADQRGFFFESWNKREFSQLTRVDLDFVQDNTSSSSCDVLRGLHYQVVRPQGKLVSAARGAIYDVAVDLRRSSPTFGKWFGIELSDENMLQLWIPPGFAHGYIVRSSVAHVNYKTTEYYAPEHERCISWADPSLDILWGQQRPPILSEKDRTGTSFDQAELYK
ncbi:dTDP-4-dehydrorhamnose 3,5-epimerase [Rhizobium metallidurans]|uniref:dTDP-4-dehydrorhamnose 3,5-epimerase n=1 Tax=Rhizobium metallidurans TaxID=1265931 RepID=A0A7W6GF20_9HYPH|nr:dTDP-4-dehydrorhamnose 3,5-epimerase [Rhizobium metallidurans]MBB3967271.1 dTDP-4-dehydrorhamnose 3,5-epimerase [Rhizobium metallidurans]